MKLKYISWLPAAIIMVIIFYFSSKPAVDSSENSMTVANEIVTVYENITSIQYTEAERMDVVAVLNHIVRKGAHFCEYALLACTFAFHLTVIKKRGKWLFLLPIVLSALYAMTDEYHQTFIPGRAGMIKDVLLDTSGAATGSLIFTLIVIIITSIQVKKANKHRNLK